jgi:hypothetical protein
MTKESDSDDNSKTLSFVQWTEFIEHDLVFTPAMRMGKFKDCWKQEYLIVGIQYHTWIQFVIFVFILAKAAIVHPGFS